MGIAGVFGVEDGFVVQPWAVVKSFEYFVDWSSVSDGVVGSFV